MYVIKIGNGYLRFGSYSTATIVDKPEKATLYSRIGDANKRKNDRTQGTYIGRTRVSTAQLDIVEVTFTSTERKIG